MKKSNSIRFRLPLIVALSYILLVIIMITTTWVQLRRNTLDRYSSIGEDVLDIAEPKINVDHIEDYLQHMRMAEHMEMVEFLQNFCNNFDDVKFMYALYLKDSEHGEVVFDLDTEDEEGNVIDEGYEVGEIYEFDKAFKENYKNMVQGRRLPPLTVKNSDGYLITLSRPLFNKDGRCIAYLFVDCSMDNLYKENMSFIAKLVITYFVFSIIVLFIGIMLVNKRVIEPITLLKNGLETLEADYSKYNIENFKRLNIPDNEIKILYKSLIYFIDSRNEYKHQYQEMSEIASIDSMTRVQNKYSYTKYLDELHEMVRNGCLTNFLAIVIDINNLKYVNDTYGHDKGDEYIKGCVNIISSVYNKNKIYRTGGDEFTILETNNNDWSKDIRDKFVQAYSKEDKPLYERYSASVGVAKLSEIDNDVFSVVQRADKNMYIDKDAFKQVNGSYR